ncbi:MAG: FlgO family outer membrane protein [Sulfuricellaceae bacterium]
MKRHISALLAGVLASVLLAGCGALPRNGKTPDPTYEQATGNTLTSVNYAAAMELMKRYQGPSASANNFGEATAAPFIVATLVNIDKLEQSSTFGRLISEQLASRITQLGHNVVELKVRNSVFMKRNEGEFLLTREIKEVATAHKAQAIVVGTYAEASDFVYVSLKVVNPTNSLILAAYDYALPMDKEIRRLVSASR